MSPKAEATGLPKSMKTSRRSHLRRQSVSRRPRARKKAIRAPPGHQKRAPKLLLDAKTYVKTLNFGYETTLTNIYPAN